MITHPQLNHNLPNDSAMEQPNTESKDSDANGNEEEYEGKAGNYDAYTTEELEQELHEACDDGNLDLVVMLIDEYGVDVNGWMGLPDDEEGCSPPCYMDGRPWKRTPLFRAVLNYNCAQCVECVQACSLQNIDSTTPVLTSISFHRFHRFQSRMDVWKMTSCRGQP
jgi:hypothetical protein